MTSSPAEITVRFFPEPSSAPAPAAPPVEEEEEEEQEAEEEDDLPDLTSFSIEHMKP